MGLSCYIVELSVDPGGARRGEVFVYSRFEHVRRIVEQEFQNDDPAIAEIAHDLLEYGERTLVWLVNDGVLCEPVDLQKYLTWKGDHFDVDWSGFEAKVPKLEGEVLRSGQAILLEDPEDRTDTFGSYLALSLGEELPYGFSDLEGGDEPPPNWVDPDPAGARDPG